MLMSIVMRMLLSVFDEDIFFGLSLTDILNIGLFVIIIAGILYSIFWKKKRDSDVLR
jgi:hypothetical protein